MRDGEVEAAGGCSRRRCPADEGALRLLPDGRRQRTQEGDIGEITGMTDMLNAAP